ncbi:hypothetical protein GQ43DRAFT_230564 [Delitschia confertaspora ATCC 74209]|uniref:PH domain-containing protein n=1 Tax=Delitschia confertaspora ATCC 74209 TaxID=1513339 RepID=A0A9P4JGS9_9PLEO|nr:hypothetical protein GQ43DRAFT_230564 [Delitschia confertaspora ATCC 74209]
MSEAQKSLATEAPAVEPAVAAPAIEEVKPGEPAAETKVEEPVTEVEASAPVEEVKEEKKEEPIYSGALGYKAPGLKNAFRFSKKYFWFGEEPVEHKNLAEYLRGEKPEVAHPTAAWASHTGKGLLFFAKHADKKETPAGVLKLSEAKDLAKDGTIAFHFKLHGQKHAFEASTSPERNGWFVAFEKAIEEAKAAEKDIVESEGYKGHLESLKKPAPLAATTSTSVPKKSTDLTVAAPADTVEEPTPARAGSSSSSSSDEDKKKKKKAKSRSVSRGKRTSFFGGLMGKKEKVEHKTEEKIENLEEKKEEKKEEKTEALEPTATEAAIPAPETTAATTVIAPLSEEEPKPAEEATTAALPATSETTEAKVEEKKPKPTKRTSIFGSLAMKLKSPTAEKKESELVPAVPAKDTEVSAEAPKVEAPLAATDASVPLVEAPKVEDVKPATTTPHKEKENFFGKFLGKAKTPTTETAPKLETAPKVEEAPKVEAPVEPVTEASVAPTEEEKKEETPAATTTPAAAATTTPAPAPKKRGSIFGNFTGSVKKGKDVAEGEAVESKSKLSGLFRKASKSVKPTKEEKETTPAATKAEETAETKEEVKVEEAPKLEAANEPTTATETPVIGDVVPEAVQVGQAPKSTTEVSATA